ncbi:MAG: hypothetical protein MK188_04345 [Gammaproteobacteria bacterium]|nr:hypothetical protein [Gammaproteobacteria bacterium]
MFLSLRNQYQFILAMVVANILLSTLSVSLDKVINNDGITYLAMAELFLSGDWETARSYYSWPFYPLLIAGVSKLFSLELTLAAHTLNALLATSLTLAFVAIVDELSDGDQRTLIVAALIILVFPSITKYRAYIIRDFGYLSFYLWSLFFILRFCRTKTKKDFIGWLFTSIASCIFRFEGMILMLIVPYFLFIFYGFKLKHKKAIVISITVAILAMSGTTAYMYLQDKYDATVRMAQLAGQDIDNIFDLFLHNIKNQTNTESTGVLGFVRPVFNNMVNILDDLVRRMAGIYFLICVAAIVSGVALKTALRRRIWIVYLAVNLGLLLSFSIANNMTVSRYTLATCLTLLPLAPIAIDHWLKSIDSYSKSQKWLVYVTIVLAILISIKNLDIRSDKGHLITAGAWIKSNVDQQAKIFSNNRILIHYADLGPETNFAERYTNTRMQEHLHSGRIKDFDFVALTHNPEEPEEAQFNQELVASFGPPIKILTGDNNRSVMIFEGPKGSSRIQLR